MRVARAFLTGILILLIGLGLAGCGQLPSTLPRSFAIVYGVADYADINDLNYSDDDATDIRVLLTTEAGVDPGDLILRTNEDATKAQLDLDFAEMADRIGAEQNPEDTRFFFYFAGHGYGDGMSIYYSFPVPWTQYFNQPQYDTEPAGAGMKDDYIFLHDLDMFASGSTEDVAVELARAAESDDDLAAHLATIPSRQRIVIIDACHSGGFLGDADSVDTVPRAYEGDGTGISFIDGFTAFSAFAEIGRIDGEDVGADTVVMTAAGEQEFSYEYSPAQGIENGVFTHYLLETPYLADENLDGYVTVSEAYGHIYQSIMSLENPYLSGQNQFAPRLGSLSVDFVLFETR